jgi:hypothetical protein
MPNNDDLTKKIMDQVEDRQMKPGWYFATREGLVLLGVLGLMGLTVFLLSFFVWDVVQNFRVFGQSPEVLGTIFSSAFLEIIILVLVFGVLVYLLYRQTDWFLVQNRLWIVLGIGLIAIVATSLVVTAALMNEDVSRPFEETQEQAERLPILRDRRNRIRQELDQRNIFVGRVEKIERQEFRDVRLIVSNPDKTEVFTSDKPRLGIREGQFVAVKFAERDGQKQVVEIRPVRPGQRLP